MLVASAAGERLAVRVYTTADGLGSSAINSLLYDSRGFLWLATRDGLARFDGFRFINYRLGAGANAENITQIFERRNGDYIILTQSNGIYRFNASTSVSESETNEFSTLNAEKIYSNSVLRLFEDREGVLWCVDGKNLFRFSEKDGELIADSPLSFAPEEKVSVNFCLEDEAGFFWLSTNRGLWRINKKGRVFTHYTTPPATAMQNYLIFLFADRNGRVWIEAQDGIFVLKPETVDNSTSIKTLPLKENIKNNLPENAGEIVKFTTADGLGGKVIPAFHETADGRVWLASDTGLEVFDGKRFRTFNASNGLGEYLTGIAEDADGNLWVSSFSGIYKVVTDGFTTYSKADGLGRADIAAIYQDKAGEIFTAEGDWFVSRFDGEKFVSVQPKLGEDRGAPLWTSNISFLDSKGAWWFLTANKLVRYDNLKSFENLTQIKPSAVFETGDQFKNGAFYRLFEDSHGDIWISTRSPNREKMGLSVLRQKENKFYSFGETENLPAGNSPSAFCEDSRGNLWIGFYYGGLARFRDGKFTVFGETDGLPKGFITALLFDKRGKLWIASSEGGVSVVEDVGAEKPSFGKIENLSSNNVRALTEDNFDRIYAGTVRGIDRILPETNQVLHLSTADGLADDFVTVAFRAKDGALWFGTRNGLSKLVPKADKSASAPLILIGGVRVAGEKQSVPELGASEVGKLDLKSTQNNLQIDFFSLSFVPAGQISYQFKLEGADADWSKPTAERTVIFSNLAAGDYRFMVRAINSQGLASENPAAVVFRISPPVWKTWWFLSLAVLLAFGAIYFLLYQRFKRILELEKVRTRIATDLHDDIGASLSRISMLSEIVKRQNGLKNQASAEKLTQIASEARGLVDSMSDIVWAINPRKDSIESVVDRVCSFAADTLGTRNVHWTVETPPDLKNLHLTTEEKRNLYLIFKEAVNNAARHSDCENASLKIRFEGGKLIVEIFDDGKGFSPENDLNGNSRGGRGLENMQTRATEIGGKLRVETSKNAGTKIILALPIQTYRINGWFRRDVK